MGEEPLPGPGVGGGTPSQAEGVAHPGKGTPPPGKGYPLPGKGVPPLQVRSQDGGGYPYRSSIACTCYAAGGVPHTGGLSCYSLNFKGKGYFRWKTTAKNVLKKKNIIRVKQKSPKSIGSFQISQQGRIQN